MKCTRKQLVLTISAAVILAGVGYGITRAFPELLDKYAGLTTHIDVQMDEATRNVVRQRLAAAQASVAASEKAGEAVDMGLYMTIAEQQFLLGDLVSAREAYETYLKLNPISAVAWDSYGAVLEYMNDYDRALYAYGQAIENGKSEDYYRDYSDLLLAHFPDRETEYKAAIDDAFTNLGQTTWTMTALGDWYFAHGECDLGRDHYEVAHALAPDNASLVTDGEEAYRACKK